MAGRSHSSSILQRKRRLSTKTEVEGNNLCITEDISICRPWGKSNLTSGVEVWEGDGQHFPQQPISITRLILNDPNARGDSPNMRRENANKKLEERLTHFVVSHGANPWGTKSFIVVAKFNGIKWCKGNIIGENGELEGSIEVNHIFNR